MLNVEHLIVDRLTNFKIINQKLTLNILLCTYFAHNLQTLILNF